VQVTGDEKNEREEALGMTDRVRGAVLWRSGSQLVAQLVTWAATFLVIRMLDPQDYGLFAMTNVLLVFLNLMNGYGFATALIQSETVERREVAQVFGLLLLLNGALAAAQLVAAPFAAAYFRQPMVADLLRVQALFYLATPFIALPNALLSRDLEFRRQAKVNLLAAFTSAGTALYLAAGGYGVWALVISALVLFWTRAIGMTIAAKSLVRPSFRFAGAGRMLRFGGAMLAVQLFWFIQTQADVVIAGRVLGPHELGLYTTALFVTQILAAKFVPPINDIAFAAYSRVQGRGDRTLALAFLKAVRLIMLAALPFYLGLAVTAEPLILTFLGAKWAATVPLVQLLALAMPLMTLQIMFAPATNATGNAGIAVRVGVAGALIMPLAFLAGISWGIAGMAWAWLAGMSLHTIVTAHLSLRIIGAKTAELAEAIAPGLLAAAAMAAAVAGIDAILPEMEVHPRLAILVLAGASLYAGLLLAFARPLVTEVTRLVRGRRPAAQAV
jgi:O-antigen/teichoic acid export membrane protein